MYNQLKDSYMWNMLNKDGQAAQKAMEAKNVGTLLTPSMMPTTISKMRNRLKSPIMKNVFDYINAGKIQMIYTDPSFRVPVYMPFMTILDTAAKEAVGLVYMANCKCFKEETEYTADEYRLKSSLESCYFALKFIEKKDSPKLISTNILRPATSIYAFMVAESINRKHSIRFDPETYNQVLYILSYFFINTVMGVERDSGVMDSYCLLQTTNPNLQQIHRVSEQFTGEDYKSIDKMIQKMASIPELQKRVGSLTVSNFTETFINVYDASVLLSLENFSFFVYNVLSTINQTYVNNYHVMKQVMGENGKKLYAALVTGIGDI